jgi:hypothetical protein
VHVEQRQLGFLHARAHSLVALGLLRAIERRSVDRDEQFRARRLGLGRRLRKPEILADGDRELASLELEDAGAIAGVEVALLVEHAVVGQLLLEVDLLDAPAAQQGRGVVARAALAVGITHDHGDVEAVRCELHQFSRALVAEVVAQPQVLGRIARQRHLGADQQFRARLAGGIHGAADAIGITGEIAHGEVQLGDGDFHGRR